MSGKKQKVEDLVLAIIASIENGDHTKLYEHLAVLEKLRKSKNKKQRINYFKVSQAFSEIGVETIVSMMKSRPMDRIPIWLLLHCMNNTAGIRRVLAHRVILLPNLKDFLNSTKEINLNTSKALQVLYRCILMNVPPEMCNQLLFDLHIDHALHNLESMVRHYNDFTILMLTMVANIYNALFDLGDDACRSYIQGLNKAGKIHLAAIATEMDNKKIMALGFYAYAETLCTKLKENKPDYHIRIQSKYDRLAKHEIESYLVFCSSPSCRSSREADKRLMHCRQCMLARYCNKDCQKQHWKDGHKQQCLKLGDLNVP